MRRADGSRWGRACNQRKASESRRDNGIVVLKKEQKGTEDESAAIWDDSKADEDDAKEGKVE
jgi:hypothetical protein